MNLSRFDMLLEQANKAVYSPHHRIQKCIEELTELNLELCHHIDGRGNPGKTAEEIADALLSIRGTIKLFEPEFEAQVLYHLEKKAKRLHERLLRGEIF